MTSVHFKTWLLQERNCMSSYTDSKLIKVICVIMDVFSGGARFWGVDFPWNPAWFLEWWWWCWRLDLRWSSPNPNVVALYKDTHTDRERHIDISKHNALTLLSHPFYRWGDDSECKSFAQGHPTLEWWDLLHNLLTPKATFFSTTPHNFFMEHHETQTYRS